MCATTSRLWVGELLTDVDPDVSRVCKCEGGHPGPVSQLMESPREDGWHSEPPICAVLLLGKLVSGWQMEGARFVTVGVRIHR